MLITFEGIDGSGKTVQSFALKRRLEENGVNCSLFSFPAYETYMGQLIYKHLHDENQAFVLDPQVVSILYAANRMELRPKILQALEDGDIVICNRYTYSNIAFQGAKVPAARRSKLISWIEELEFNVFQLPRPDIVLLLLLPPLKAAEFIAAKKDKTKQGADQYERNQEFLQDVYTLYQQLADSRDNWIAVRCFSDEESLSKNKVAELVAEAVVPIIKK
ncbi:MAG: dTMP kinase [Candidatus Heimdallarchaeota archaeon]